MIWAAGVARRTLYNQFASKEEIFREVLLTVSHLFEDALPLGIETQGDVEEVLRLVAQKIFGAPQEPGIPRIFPHGGGGLPPVPLDCRRVRRRDEPERFARYLDHLNAMGVLNCRA